MRHSDIDSKEKPYTGSNESDVVSYSMRKPIAYKVLTWTTKKAVLGLSSSCYRNRQLGLLVYYVWTMNISWLFI